MQCSPVHRREVLALFDVLNAVLHVAIATGHVHLEQVLDAVLYLRTEVLWELELSIKHKTVRPRLIPRPTTEIETVIKKCSRDLNIPAINQLAGGPVFYPHTLG